MAPVLLILAAILASAIAFAQGSHADATAPLLGPPRNAARLNDAVTKLVRRLDAGETTLAFDTERGFLPAVLRELNLPVSSQVLVFSKTSLQHLSITPQTPRAIYFNDDVYAGFVPDGRLIELSAVDPDIGPVFYTITQSATARPHLVTNADCAQCHATPATMSLPGYLVRSVFTSPDGQVAPRVRSFLTDHRSPMEERWGGWYVTGTLSGDQHMGNAVLRNGDDEASFDRVPGTNMKNVAAHFRSERYLSTDSDVVALMVLEHQARMHNLLTRLHYDASQGQPVSGDVEDLLRYALFVDEAPLKGPITGTTAFATEFEQRGPKDSQGRSVRQFDLRTRMFRYPCSYLVYSDAFLSLPASVKQQIYGRLGEILSGRDSSEAFRRLQPPERRAIAEILTATHPEFAASQRLASGLRPWNSPHEEPPLPRLQSRRSSDPHSLPAGSITRSSRLRPSACRRRAQARARLMAAVSQGRYAMTNDFLGTARALSPDGLEQATAALSATPPAIWAVMSVETHGCGFLPDRRPVILFERHIFHRRTKGAFDATSPGISASMPGGYLGGSGEYARLERALAVDHDAALNSTSWGLAQIMGFNAPLTRFVTAGNMVAAMADGEDAQLQAMADFLVARQLDKPLSRRDWTTFARGYNGPSYRKNQYDARLAAAYATFKTGPLPDLSVRQAQVLLTFLGFAPGVIDGVLGKRTRSAIVLFRQQQGLGASDTVTGPLLVALSQAVAGLPPRD